MSTTSVEVPPTNMEIELPSERVPALARLGPAPEQDDVPESEPTRIPTKKRLGRPPLRTNQEKPLGVKAGPPTENEVNLKVSDLISNETKEWEKQRVERSFPHLADNILSIKTNKWGGPLGPWILWAIWSSRNQKLFQKRNFHAQETITKAIVDAKEWSEAQAKIIPETQRKNSTRSRGEFEVICRSDAAWKEELQAAGLAWSFYGSQNERFSSHSRSIALVISSLVAEGLAIRAAMEHAIALRLKCVLFETDSLQLVTTIEEGSSFSDLHGIISDIYLLSNFFDSVSFRFCRRDVLSFEDSLAKQSLSDFGLN
ncbi:hypothetical protein DY000_02026964 [Brassica cretica]|uniref:RNase H type-1 domain-containing protein n=1 Tax=Brassica cretica TaxID=69181 RepID=A0ABQ7EI50_BRACR|nr:hypothetical protein DY000_02026964 [Brassica cretica]